MGHLYTLFISFVCLLCLVPMALAQDNVPVPVQKPVTGFSSLLAKIERNATTHDSVSEVMLPPQTPALKRPPKPRAPENTTVQFGGTTPFPAPKPLSQKIYTQYVNDRQAGGSQTTIVPNDDMREHEHRFNRIKPTQAREVERIYSARTASRRNRIDLEETNNPSPFKSAALPKAGKKNQNEPVIIFFQENSLKLEIGQKEVLAHDVLKRLKRQRSLRITIHGFNHSKTSTLSADRAHGVSDYLTRNGISQNRIIINDMKDKTHIYPKDRVDIEFH